MGIQRVARGVRVATQAGYLVGRLRGNGQAKEISVQELGQAIAATGTVAVVGSAPPATIVAGTVNRITSSLAGITYTIDISASYVGQASITTLGTVSTGTWSATTIAVNKGGTGQTSYTDGQLLIGNTTGNTLAKGSLTAPAAGITITGGSGSITFALANDLSALEALSSTGLAARTASDTWAQRTITGTSNRITATNGDGVSGNPTLDISSSYVGQNTITTLGTIGTGTWQGTVIAGTYGGTGVNNGASTITIGGNVTHAGAFASTITVTAITNSTLPAGTHTLAGLDVAQTWSANQQFNDGNFQLKGATSGTLTQKVAAVAGTNTLTWPAGTTDFSATGGSKQFVKQSSAGAALTVATIAATDLPDGAIWIGRQVITATGTYTPTTGTTIVDVTICGGGGGGGGAGVTSGSQVSLAGAGAAGGVSRKRMTSGFSGVTVTIGAGGSGASAGINNGTAGGNSSFGAVLTANGGGLGSGGGPSAGVGAVGSTTGGTASGGDINIQGGNGYGTVYPGTGVAAMTGPGGNTPLGLGLGGGPAVSGGGGGVAGIAGSGYGSGGSGAVSAGAGSNQGGGAGAAGVCIIDEYR